MMQLSERYRSDFFDDDVSVSYAMCERVVERDARITHFAQTGWWRVRLENRTFAGQTRPDAVALAAIDLQRRLERS